MSLSLVIYVDIHFIHTLLDICKVSIQPDFGYGIRPDPAQSSNTPLEAETDINVK